MKFFLDNENQRESFRHDAVKAWEDYQATGLHVTADEVAEWLSSWGSAVEKPAPICGK